MTTKIDFINSAYSEARISGLTVNPTPEDLELALEKLEDMAAMFEGNNICTGYYFESSPDLNSPHNVERKYWDSYKTNLAIKLLDHFGKQPTKLLYSKAQTGLSFLSARTAQLKRTPYPGRQPVGSKNRLFQSNKFYGKTEEAPQSCYTNTMYVDDVDNFTEDYTAWLKDGETISSYVITSDTGLTVVSDSNTDTAITYQIRADGTSDSGDPLLELKIVMTSSDSRILTRIINFKLISAEI